MKIDEEKRVRKKKKKEKDTIFGSRLNEDESPIN